MPGRIQSQLLPFLVHTLTVLSCAVISWRVTSVLCVSDEIWNIFSCPLLMGESHHDSIIQDLWMLWRTSLLEFFLQCPHQSLAQRRIWSQQWMNKWMNEWNWLFNVWCKTRKLHCVSKKVPTFELSVTLSKYSKFLYCWKVYEICYKTLATFHLALGMLLHYLGKLIIQSFCIYSVGIAEM